MYNSDARQDRFVSKILKNKNHGYYVDIGSCDSFLSNNTYFFSTLDWSGICIEINSIYNGSYINRNNCKYINEDATKIDYSKIFKDMNSPSVIDYLSLDVDTKSLDVLKLLPFGSHIFKVITIEHDSYIYGDTYKSPQRKILSDNGYLLLFGDVYVEQSGYEKNCSFEDWWVHPSQFDTDYLFRIKSSSLYPSEIIERI